jgi:hypothetical protein
MVDICCRGVGLGLNRGLSNVISLCLGVHNDR